LCFGNGFFFRVNRVEALIDLGNAASRSLLEKLGFVQEGIRREYGYWKDRFRDVRSFALLRRDWRR
jgi:ribosomal-protein-alanine N-acetyltransferase